MLIARQTVPDKGITHRQHRWDVAAEDGSRCRILRNLRRLPQFVLFSDIERAHYSRVEAFESEGTNVIETGVVSTGGRASMQSMICAR